MIYLGLDLLQSNSSPLLHPAADYCVPYSTTRERKNTGTLLNYDFKYSWLDDFLLSSLNRQFSEKFILNWSDILVLSSSPQVILSQSQDKSLRRIGELREVWLCGVNVAHINICPPLYKMNVLNFFPGASNGSTGQETPTRGVWCCPGREGSDDYRSSNTGQCSYTAKGKDAFLFRDANLKLYFWFSSRTMKIWL